SGLLGLAQEMSYRLSFLHRASATDLSSISMEQLCNTEASGCFQKMQLESLFTDVQSCACNLRLCSNLRVVNESLHVEIERKGLLEKNVFVGNTLMAMYTRSGQLTKARQVFDSLQVWDVVSWNVLISGY
ncbi:hypothetical protein L7F22_006365, partial [Adiantum nelumboides]|nr:hypothetical protein [Adiantum nelumboides]